jgi:protein SCO1/2
MVAAIGAVVVALAVWCAFALLRAWHVPAGGEQNSATLIESLPQPRLQTAPQLKRFDPAPEIEQRLGARLPSGLKLIESNGAAVDWKAWRADARPIVLLPAYYRCDTLCGTVAHGVLEALADTGLPSSAWRLALFSIDPTDSPADARALQAVYAKYAVWSRPSAFGFVPPEIHLLTGAADETRAVARTIGFRWIDQGSVDGSSATQFAHATGVVVLTADGVVSRYLLGVRFDPMVLRSAIVEASEGRVGTLADRLLLACSHLDPALGTYDGLVIASMRGVALVVLLSLGWWIWGHRSMLRIGDEWSRLRRPSPQPSPGGRGSTASLQTSPGGRGSTASLQTSPGGRGGTASLQTSPGGRGSTASLQTSLGGRGSTASLQPSPGGRGSTASLQPSPGGRGGTASLQHSPGGRGSTASLEPSPGGRGSHMNSAEGGRWRRRPSLGSGGNSALPPLPPGEGRGEGRAEGASADANQKP